MTLGLALNTAVSGLSTAQAGLNVISSNIANVNTEGYTRKIFEPSSRILGGTGAGVELGDVRSNVDQNLLRDIREERSTFGRLDAKNRFLKQIQDMFGSTSSNNSISHRLNDFQREWETLATEPDKSTAQTTAVQAGVTVADQLSRMSKTIQGLRLDADREIERSVREIAQQLSTISKLNDQIALGSSTARQTEDFEDKRDLALSKLADLVDIQYFFNSNGSVTVFTTDGTTLVGSAPVATNHSALSIVSADNTYASGDFNAIFAGMRDITSTIRSGKIAALVELRDKTLPDMQSQIDELGRNMMEEINLIHNRGTAFPQLVNNVTGSRTFMNSAGQTLNFSGGETRVVLYDANGDEKFSSRVLDPAGINFTNGGTVDSLASSLQTWLQGLDPQLTNATVSVDSNGKFKLNLGTDRFGITFRDEDTTVKGSDPKDVTVAIDLDADGNADQSFSGFSNFLGLNDYFVNSPRLSTWDSKLKQANFSLGVVGSRDLQFSDQTNPTLIPGGTVTVNAGDSLQTIADKINQNAALQGRIRADVVPEGSGFKLRIQHEKGEQLIVTQAAGNNNDAIQALGLDLTNSGLANRLRVNDTLIQNPAQVSRGRVQFDNVTGRYTLSPGDNQIAQEMSRMLSGQVSFNQAGSLSSANVTFTEYSASIISFASTLQSGSETDLKFQTDLRTSLEQKHGELSGVNLDEEMSNLLVYQQTYAASAKVISVTQQLFDVLNNIIR